MKAITIFALQLLLCVLPLTGFAQNFSVAPTSVGGEYSLQRNDGDHPCITPDEYRIVEKRCGENIKSLHLESNVHKKTPNPAAAVTLDWPLRMAAGLNDCSYYVITNYVDQDPASGKIKDYNCGTTTYDGHTGTDIAIWPFPQYKMDNNQVEIIAAAPGTIIDKKDGNFDKNCAMNNSAANYVVVQHSDGSRALYWHMKKNSVTAKAIGKTVVVGEYLGVVGSSGNSTGPHLHFEVWSGNTFATRIDPYSGPCNLLNSSSWWASQKSYLETQIEKLAVYTTAPVFPPCPQTETPNEIKCINSDEGTALFYSYKRNEAVGMVANYRILNPDGTVFNSWSHKSTTNWNAAITAWRQKLPTIAGTYTFDATFNGITCSTTFDIINATITPSRSLSLCQGDSVILTAPNANSYQWSNGSTNQSITVTQAGDYSVTVKSAFGCSATSAITTVKVASPLMAAITPKSPTTICSGSSVTLIANAASSYLWNTADTTQTIVASAAGDYYVTITDANGCSATSPPTTVTINPLPLAVITPNRSTGICEGDSVILRANNAKAYFWNNGATTQSTSIFKSGNYFVTIIDSNRCSARSPEITVTVVPLPTAAITPSGSTTMCKGDEVTLTADSASSYLWSNGATTQGIAVVVSGNYFVTVTNANGCSASSTSTIVKVNPLPVTTITKNGSILTADAKDALYQWLDCGNNFTPISEATKQSYTASIGGNYAVSLSSNGCSDTSACYSVSLTEVNAPLSDEAIRIYPNPTTGKLILKTSLEINNIQVYNVLGEKIYQSNTMPPASEIDIASEPEGVYYVKISSANKREIIKVVKF